MRMSGRIRTLDTRFWRPLLYQLSYTHKLCTRNECGGGGWLRVFRKNFPGVPRAAQALGPGWKGRGNAQRHILPRSASCVSCDDIAYSFLMVTIVESDSDNGHPVSRPPIPLPPDPGFAARSFRRLPRGVTWCAATGCDDGPNRPRPGRIRGTARSTHRWTRKRHRSSGTCCSAHTVRAA